ncbi:MAG: CotH kinase family protein, partial [Oscillospiraceae bacterium]|nr:CotH kinase family protein [Oscillospiraceae bacterium]
MKHRILFFFLTLVVIAGLLPAVTLPVVAATAPTKMWIEPSETNNIPAQIDVFKAKTGGTNNNPTYTYQLYLPGNANLANCYLSWDGDTQATVEGSTYTSGSCPIPPVNTETTYTFTSGNQTGTSLKVITYQGSANVMPVFIEVDESDGKPTIAQMDGDPDHEVTCSGTINIDGAWYDMPKIKGRGNATWENTKDKKPYNVTLDAKVTLGLDTPATKKWSFLAEAYDHSLLCNRSGFYLGEQLGIAQDTLSADVWMNGEYQGCYTITPKTDSFVTKDGFMIEQDNYLEAAVADGGDPQFKLDGLKEASGWSSCYNRITVKKMGDNLLKVDGVVDESPENLEAVANGTLKPWLQDALNAILSSTGYNDKGKYYTDYIDIESFAKMYLMHEYVKSYDVCAGSILFYRDGQTDAYKLMAGPLWDLDNALGSTCSNSGLGSQSDRRSAEGEFICNITEYKTSIYKNLGLHNDFMEEVKRQYNINKAAFDGLADAVQSMIDQIADSAKMNHIKVIDISGTYVNLHKYNQNTTLGSGNYRQSYLATKDSKTDWVNYAANLKTYITTRSLWFEDTYYDPSFVDPATCDHEYQAVITVQPTCINEGEVTYTCPICHDSYTEIIEKPPHDYQDGVCTVCGETLVNVSIFCDDGASVTVYETQDLNGASEASATLVHPRDSDTGLIDCSGEGQINLVVNLEPGYELISLTAAPKNYKNLKGPDDTGIANGYRLTKVTGDFIITVTAERQTYTITWNNYDGSTLKTEQVAYGETPSYNDELPIKEADEQYTYIFNGWEPDIAVVTEDVTYTATYISVPLFTVNVINGTGFYSNNTSGSSFRVPVGEVVEVTADDSPAGREFDHWEVVFGDITLYDPNAASTSFTMGESDITIEAVYKTDLASLITSVSVSITEPDVGAKPDYNAIISADENYIVKDHTLGSYKNGVCWEEPGEDEGLAPDSDVFEAGHAYTVMCLLVPKDGYQFSVSAESLTATINGIPATIGDLSPDEIRIEYTFPTLSEGLTITTQPTPKTVAVGTSVSFKVVATGATSYQWQLSSDGGTTWKNCSSTGYNTDTFTFTAGTAQNNRRYRCVV